MSKTENTSTTPEDTYRAARATGRSDDACRAVLRAHPGISFDDVVDMSWRIETGKAAPEWMSDPDHPRAAAWYAGHEKARVGSEGV